jgi:adenosine deaminase CECR1
MPKGGLLHAHLDAMVNARTLLELAVKQPAMHVRVPTPLNKLSLASTLPQFSALTAEEKDKASSQSLTEPSYQAGSWVSLAKARQNFDPALGGPEGFDRWVFAALTISPNEAYKTHNTVPKACLFTRW